MNNAEGLLSRWEVTSLVTKEFMCFLSICWLHCRILVPWPGVEPTCLQWKSKVWTTGPPRKSETCFNTTLDRRGGLGSGQLMSWIWGPWGWSKKKKRNLLFGPTKMLKDIHCLGLDLEKTPRWRGGIYSWVRLGPIEGETGRRETDMT